MTTPVIINADCLDYLAMCPDDHFDAIVTDPPYGLGFMGKDWDDLPPGLPWARECLRVLKPGGHLLAFGGTRTWHRLAVAVEDAGFEIRDSIAWLYGSGFPKSMDVSKAIDKAAGATREVVGSKLDRPGYHLNGHDSGTGALGHGISSTTPETRLAASQITAPATPEAEQWQGWGTALKPAFEPIVVARKPIRGTVAANVLEHGTGALNIDGCRIGTDIIIESRMTQSAGGVLNANGRDVEHGNWQQKPNDTPAQHTGRWPANVILDEDQAAALDQQSGIQRDGIAVKRNRDGKSQGTSSWTLPGAPREDAGYGGSGGASRFFYIAKAPKKERPTVDGVAHPTVKPVSLMRWLIRLVTPPGGHVLDPFAGSGATVEAALRERVKITAVEREAAYIPLIQARLDRHIGTQEELDL